MKSQPTILLAADQQGSVDADEGKSNRATEMNMVQLLLKLRPYQQEGAEDDFSKTKPNQAKLADESGVMFSYML